MLPSWFWDIVLPRGAESKSKLCLPTEKKKMLTSAKREAYSLTDITELHCFPSSNLGMISFFYLLDKTKPRQSFPITNNRINQQAADETLTPFASSHSLVKSLHLALSLQFLVCEMGTVISVSNIPSGTKQLLVNESGSFLPFGLWKSTNNEEVWEMTSLGDRISQMTPVNEAWTIQRPSVRRGLCAVFVL